MGREYVRDAGAVETGDFRFSDVFGLLICINVWVWAKKGGLVWQGLWQSGIRISAR